MHYNWSVISFYGPCIWCCKKSSPDSNICFSPAGWKICYILSPVWLCCCAMCSFQVLLFLDDSSLFTNTQFGTHLKTQDGLTSPELGLSLCTPPSPVLCPMHPSSCNLPGLLAPFPHFRRTSGLGVGPEPQPGSYLEAASWGSEEDTFFIFPFLGDLGPASCVVHGWIIVVSCLCLVVHLLWGKGWLLSLSVCLGQTWKNQWY